MCVVSSVQTHTVWLSCTKRLVCELWRTETCLYSVYKVENGFPLVCCRSARGWGFPWVAFDSCTASSTISWTVQTVTVQEQRPAANVRAAGFTLTFLNKFVITPSVLFLCVRRQERILMTWWQTTGRRIKSYVSCCYKILHFGQLKKFEWNLQQNTRAVILISGFVQEYLQFLLLLLLRRLYGATEGTWTQKRKETWMKICISCDIL